MLRMTCDESYLPTVKFKKKKNKNNNKKTKCQLISNKIYQAKNFSIHEFSQLAHFFFFYKKNYKTKCNILNLVTNIHSKLLRNRNTTVVLSKIHTPKLM